MLYEFPVNPSNNLNSIDVITTSGSLVKQIFNGNTVDGKNLVKWNGTNGNGVEVTAGIYYIRIVTDNNVETVKISKSK
ncbi:MAG: T9SS type A sorting domain-containing protein [Bacteroidales bacterium]|nr:T9SS type A sorting domain-containing protein [Bacteroidales bacterium]